MPIQVPGVEYEDRITVAGKDPQVYLLPEAVKIECAKKCPACNLPEESVELTIPRTAMQVARLVGVSDRAVEDEMRSICRLKQKCPIHISSARTYPVTAVSIVPDISTLKSRTEQYSVKPAFSLVELERGKTYDVKLGIGINPKNQQGTTIISAATTVRGLHEGFTFEPKAQQELRNKFGACTDRRRVMAAVRNMADEHSSITGIVGRPDLHILTSLVYHSVLEFRLPNRAQLTRGWLQALIIGDERCGKGKTVEGLLTWFGVGDIVSGQNTSKMGLLGGVMYDTGRPIASWGRFPLADRGFLGIDEFHSLRADVISDLSRMRSEGLAELSKGGLHEKVPARVRLIMVCNTLKRKHLAHYRFGIEAVPDVFPTPADISRLDMVAGAMKDDVPIADIVEMPQTAMITLPQTVEQQHVLWAWSLTPDDIEFTPDAYACMVQHALPRLIERYTSEVPLVLGQEMHEKLGRIACAVAVAVFSTKRGNSRMPTLCVMPAHVMAAVDVLDDMYSRPALQYDRYSQLLRSLNEPIDCKAVEDLLEKGTGGAHMVAQSLLSLHETTSADILDIVGFTVSAEARVFLARLVTARAYIRKGHHYVKTASFISWLKERVEKP